MISLKNGFRYAFRGLCLAWMRGINFRIEILSALLVLTFAWLLRFSPAEYTVLILAITLVLAAETFNTALEEFCDKFQPTHDPHIEKIKDLSAAAVLITALGALCVGIVITIPHVW